jgi:hypothetical protein
MHDNNAVMTNKIGRSHANTAGRVPCRVDNKIGLRMACAMARRLRGGFQVRGLSARA